MGILDFNLVFALGLAITSWAPAISAEEGQSEKPTVEIPVAPAATSVNGSHSAPQPLIVLDRVPVLIHAETPGRRFDVRSEKNEVIARCMDHCTLHLPLGTYRMRVFEGDEPLGGETGLEVTGPAMVQVSDPNINTYNAGAIMGGVGPFLAVGGVVLMAHGICWESCTEAQDTELVIGLGAFVAGAVMTPIGWVLYARNRRARVDQQPLVLPYLVRTRDKGGGVIGLQGTF